MLNLAELTGRLIAGNVEFVLLCGFAAIAHGVLGSSRDVDICCRFSEENLIHLQKAVADLHPVRCPRTDLPLQLTAAECAGLKNSYSKTDLGILDCLGEIKGVGSFDEVAKHSVELELPIGECRVIDLDTLIVATEAMNRDHDRITVKDLKAIKQRQHQS